MGEMVDVVDSKNSPRRSAIEKAQAELRQEYYVREERKRELEFLEKGGNPLDFKVGSTSSVSLQSTSATEQLIDYDAKGSSTVATSTHGDSEDSCIKPGTMLGKDSITADNLLLIDGQHSQLDGSRNEWRPVKRKAISSSEHPPNKVAANIRDSEESGSFRFGVKSQAYARRNRSRPSRENAGVSSPRSTPSTSNTKPSLLPSPSPSLENKDKKEPELDIEEELKTVSLISNSIPNNLGGIDISNALDKGNAEQAESDAGVCEVPLAGEHTQEVDTSEKKVDDTVAEQMQKDEGTRSPQAAENPPSMSDSSVREPASTHTAVRICPPNDNSNETESVSLNMIDCQNDKVYKHSDLQNVEEASNDLGRESSKVNPDHVSYVAMESSIPAEIVSLAEIRDLKTAVVDPSANLKPVDSDIQVKIEESHESAKSSLGNENHEANQKKDKDSDSPSRDVLNCNLNDFQAVLEPSGVAHNNSSAASDVLNLPEKKFSEKARDDAILKEARLIEAKMRRVNKLSSCSFPSEKHKKSHWDYLLEEMEWLANDFIQERRWKIAAASQMSRQVAWAACREWGNSRKQIETAHFLAKSISSFWDLAEALHTGRNSIHDMDKVLKSTLFLPMQHNKGEAAHKQAGQNFEGEPFTRAAEVPVLDYAVRFLGCNSIKERPMMAEAPATPDRNCDSGVSGMPWEDQSSEESLFYVIPAGAMKVYRESIESRWLQHENTSNMMHHEDFDPLAEHGLRENTSHEDEAEAHYFSGKLERNKFSKFAHKKKKFFQDKNHSARSFEGRPDLSYGPHSANQPSLMSERRGSGTFNVSSIPTKRMRTASRQRIVSPFGVGNASQPMNSKTDASSGDTNSFQDDHASFHGESMARRNADFESTADFDRKFVFDGSDTSMRLKKKKKQRHMGYRNLSSPDGFGISKASSYDYRWQNEPTAQIDQKDHLKKRVDGHHFDSFGSAGVHGQHAAKKPKLLRHMPDTSPDSINPVSGSHPSPAASQISSMPATNKLIKLITNRDRNRKNKGLKMIGQLGSGGSWSQFEDQALVVLVHDMGTNWELVSDTINSTLQFKCIFRTPSECKERHKILMERSAGDGADSAEDSGSSQSYPSTLPGIPKGSARQLFQRLQGPMEEDTLKSHFEKIILIGRQLHFRQVKSESKETKLMTQVHSSHFHALTQACPNNLTGSPLTPLELAEVTQSSETPGHIGFQSSQPARSPVPSNSASLPPSIMPSSGATSIVSGSASLAISNGLSSPSASSIANPRDSRYNSPKPSFPVDEQQRVQQYSPLISGRSSLQQPAMSGPGTLTMGIDRGVRMLSGGNSLGMFSGGSNGLPASPRPGFQGIGSPAVLNTVSSGPMLSVSGVNSHSNSVQGQANSLLRQRPPQNAEDHKQMMMPDVQLPPTQPGVPMGSINGPFPGGQGGSATAVATPVQSFSSPQPPHIFGGNTHHHPSQMPSQHTAYAMRFAKERQQLQQRLLHQQPHFPPSNSSTSLQSSQPSPGSPAQHIRPQGNPRHPVSGGGNGATLNPRQRHQPQTMPPRHHQHLQSQQRFSGQGGLFSGGSGSAATGQQKMYPRPQPPSRPVGPAVQPQQEVPASQPLPRQQPIHSSQQAMQRILLQQNNHHMSPTEGQAVSTGSVDLAQVNSTSGPSPVLSGSDSASPASGPGPQWKPEASPQKQTLVGTEVSVLQPGQGLTKRFSGLPSNVHGVGGQWQQQQKLVQQQQPPQDQSQPMPNQHNRQLAQSGPLGTSSNTKPL